MNKVILIGRLTRDPELRYTTNGMAVARFNFAVDRRMSKEKKKEAESKNQQTADFISCVAWNKTAELVCNFLQKGSKAGIEGKIQTGSYEKEGQKIYTTDVVVLDIEFLDSVGSTQNTSTSKGQIDENLNGFFPIDDEDIPF